MVHLASLHLITILIIAPTQVHKTSLKHFLKIMFIPPNRRLQPRKLPYPINLSIIMLVRSMAVALQFHRLQVRCSINLVSGAQLVVSDDLSVRNALPAGGAEEMLGLDAGVAEEVVVGYHLEKVSGGHGFPAPFADFGVVDKEGWGEDFAEA